MASLTKKTDCKNWIACFMLPDGTRTNRSTGTTDRKLAQEMADKMEAAARQVRAGIFNEVRARKFLNDMLERAGEDKFNTDTVEVYLRDWLKSKDNAGTSERYTHTVDLFLQSLGEKAKAYLTSITYKDIQKFIESRKSGVVAKTISVDVKTLSTAFNLAKRLHFIPDNPVEKCLALNPLKSKSMERSPFTGEQVASLLKVATAEWQTAIFFGYCLGARLEDCVCMQWNNVNFEKGLIDYVSRKRGVRAVVPMTPELQAHLESIATDTAEQSITPGLADIYARKGSGGKAGLSATFAKLMATAGIDSQTVEGEEGKRKFNRLSFHSLRHAFNSALANNGVDQETRMALIGQVTKAVNADYTHLDLAKLRAAVTKLPSLKK
jgi:integrase